MAIDAVVVRQISFPLIQPYKLSNGPKLLFDPYLVEIRSGESVGWGECMVSVGYTNESREDSWRAALAIAPLLPGCEVEVARERVASRSIALPGMRSAFYGALDMLRGNALLRTTQDRRVPLLAPCQESEIGALRDEVEGLLGQGFRTLKVKVGFDWQDDLARVERIQSVVGARASLRLDANRGFDLAAGIAFASRLDPTGIELFEQPCAADDWEANAAVAARSTVPLMLDESIYDVGDIDRAAKLPNVGFVKLKLKKIGSVDQLQAGLERIRNLGMTPVLGDGVSLEIACWMEACVAVHGIRNAGEMNGFLKARSRLLENPLVFDRGDIVLPAGYWPQVDHDALARNTVRQASF
ncbi:mandelate racemase/muconate lactonizing enzyme family protein [Pigmentiphaga daeguensis]|uniref:Dipeptide epimerase n=1 Tax=Pigmentiphaga daeguensis TaxID=414049 RepID=A0ABN1CXG7_9BURK